MRHWIWVGPVVFVWCVRGCWRVRSERVPWNRDDRYGSAFRVPVRRPGGLGRALVPGGFAGFRLLHGDVRFAFAPLRSSFSNRIVARRRCHPRLRAGAHRRTCSRTCSKPQATTGGNWIRASLGFLSVRSMRGQDSHSCSAWSEWTALAGRMSKECHIKPTGTRMKSDWNSRRRIQHLSSATIR